MTGELITAFFQNYSKHLSRKGFVWRSRTSLQCEVEEGFELSYFTYHLMFWELWEGRRENKSLQTKKIKCNSQILLHFYDYVGSTWNFFLINTHIFTLSFQQFWTKEDPWGTSTGFYSKVTKFNFLMEGRGLLQHRQGFATGLKPVPLYYITSCTCK
jgi:hypothetical protein